MKKLLYIFYGEEIDWALRKDELLKAAAKPEGLGFDFADPDHPTHDEEATSDEIWYLEHNGFLAPRIEGGYRITVAGQTLLSEGGFKAEAMKSKNDVKAFGISVTALVISMVSLALSLFDWLGR